MAITYDNSTAASDGSSVNNSLTKALTIGSGSNGALVVFTKSSHGRTQSGVTYNSVAMTQKRLDTHASHSDVASWLLVNPASGTHNIVFSISGNDVMELVAVSAFGVDPTNPVDLNSFANTDNNSAITDNSSSVNANEFNCIALGYDSSTVASPAFTLGTNQTSRQSTSLSNNNGMELSTQPFTTPGNYTWSYQFNAGGIGAMELINLSLNPFNPSVDALPLAGD